MISAKIHGVAPAESSPALVVVVDAAVVAAGALVDTGAEPRHDTRRVLHMVALGELVGVGARQRLATDDAVVVIDPVLLNFS